MKTKILFFVVGLFLFSSFTSEINYHPNKSLIVCPIPTTTNFTIGISPSSSIVGNTQYDLLVSYAPGNAAYRIIPYFGFTVLSKNPTDIATPPNATIFRIKTNIGATTIRGVAVALDCNGVTSSSSNMFIF